MKACVLGDSGLLGQALVQSWGRHEGHDIAGISSSAFEPTPYWQPMRSPYRHLAIDLLADGDGLATVLEREQPTVVVNCAALVNLQECESNPLLAERLNARLPSLAAAAARRIGASFIQISTDQVYRGDRDAPHAEREPTGPTNQYGRSKRAGEENALRHHPRALVVRTNIVGFRDRPSRPTFAEWLCLALLSEQSITLFEDYVTSSIHVTDLARLLLEAVQKRITGIYNIATRDALSKYEFGRRLAAKAELDFRHVTKGSLAVTPLAPPRPPSLRLDVRKVEADLGLSMPVSHDTIDRVVKDFEARRAEGFHG